MSWVRAWAGLRVVVNGLRRTTREDTCRSTQTVDHDAKPDQFEITATSAFRSV